MGGIVFLIAIIISGVVYPNYLLAAAGATVIGVISFLHDRFGVPRWLRVLFHIVAVLMMFEFLPVFIIMPWWAIAILCLFVVGAINVYSFADRLKGNMTFLSLIVLASLQYVNIAVFNFVERDLIWLPLIACVLFILINFRKRLICSAGKVGAVTMAFWIMFLLFRLILDSGRPEYILFLLVYGLGFVWTKVGKLVLRIK